MNSIESSSSGLPGPWYWYEISWWLFLGRGQHGGASRWNGHRGRFACHLQRTYVCCALLIHLVCSKKSYRRFSYIWSYIYCIYIVFSILGGWISHLQMPKFFPVFRGNPPFSFPPTHEERHQWLELTLRPSLQTYVCDLWVADAVGNDALRWSIVEEGFCLGSIFSYSCWNFQEWQRQEERQALSKSRCWTLGRLIKIGSIPTGASTLANKFVQKNQVMSSCQIFEFRVPSINWYQMIFW